MKNIGIFERIKNAVTPAPEISTDSNWNNVSKFFGFESDLGNTKLTSPTYYACMQIRCNAIAKLPLKLMEETAGGAVKAVNHPAYRLMKSRPNAFTTLHDFLWATEFQRLEYGNSFWLPQYDTRGKLKNICLLSSLQMEIMVDNAALLGSPNSVYYIYSDAEQGQIIYSSESILHFKNFSKDGIIGTSVKKYLYDVIEGEQHANKLIKNKNKTGLQNPIVITYSGDLNDAKKNSIKKKFADLGGVSKAGQVIPVPTDFSLKQLETKFVDSQFFELQGLTARRIANGFGVKGFQLNDMEKSTYNNIEQQNRAFYSDTLQNVLTEYEQEMDYKLLPAKEQGKYYWQFNVDAILRSDLESRYRAYQIGVASGFLEPAEARSKENLPFVSGTDKLYFGNGAVIPAALAGEQYKSNSMKGGENFE